VSMGGAGSPGGFALLAHAPRSRGVFRALSKSRFFFLPLLVADNNPYASS